MFAPAAGMRPLTVVLDLTFAERTDAGRMRENDEDYLGHAEPATQSRARSHGWLFALADGVGGHERGEVASREAVEDILAGFQAAPAGEPPAALLARLVQSANLHVYEMGKNTGSGGVAMATTAVVCILRHDRVTVAHAGDSRCYLIRNGQAEALTRDHTVARDQARLGVISAREEAESASRHVLTRSLGAGLFLNVDIAEQTLEAGDVLALCCDGLHNSVTGGEIAAAVDGGASLEEAARKLVDLANQRDGSDNITVQLIRVRSVERVGMYRGRPYKLR
jgi:protein phosphatase